MPNQSRFAEYDLVAFIATSNRAAAKEFYGKVLGLRLVSDDGFALVFDAHGTTLRIAIVSRVVAAAYTVLGWRVPDIVRAVRDLRDGGVELQRYEGMEQDSSGIWRSPNGARVAWFKDPDGNVLSVTEFSPSRPSGANSPDDG